MSDYLDYGSAQLRKALNVMFPQTYIRLYHTPPNSICSLMNIQSCKNIGKNDHLIPLYEISTEPSSRESIMALREQLDSSLIEHQAKPTGLCPIRRTIYNQCFDEIIRQVTVSCIEQGVLLFRIRNEIRMTLGFYRGAYESGVRFGLNKAIEAELKTKRALVEMQQLATEKSRNESQSILAKQSEQIEIENKLELAEKMRDYYMKELKEKDATIIQQKSVIQALESQRSAYQVAGSGEEQPH